MKKLIKSFTLLACSILIFTGCGHDLVRPDSHSINPDTPTIHSTVPNPDSAMLQLQQDLSATSRKGNKPSKVKLCHLTGSGSYTLIEVSQNAVSAHLAHGDTDLLSFYQGFEENTDSWYDENNGWYGLITRVSSGTDGIASSMGSWHSIFEGDVSSAPFTSNGGYLDTWPGTWVAEIDIYLDPSWSLSQGFDYTVASSGSDGSHQRDFIFHVNKDASTGNLQVAGSNNTNFAPREDLENLNHYVVTTAGWYTFQHLFYDDGGALSVDLNLIDSGGNILFTETRTNPADVIATEIGGNRYGWFTFINVADGIAVDEHNLRGNCAL